LSLGFRNFCSNLTRRNRRKVPPLGVERIGSPKSVRIGGASSAKKYTLSKPASFSKKSRRASASCRA
jgi:hypothetical protein